MAALDFPSSPQVGDKYPTPAVPGVPQYTYDGEKWLTNSGAIYAGSPATVLPLPDAPTAVVGVATKYAREDHVHPIMQGGGKNYILNGAMRISQEWGSAAVTTNMSYVTDGFQLQYAHAGTVTGQQVASLTPGGSPNRIRITATAADAAVAATDWLSVRHVIEGLRIADLKSGTAAAKTITIQFGVKAPAGTYCVSVQNGALNRVYVAEFVIAVGEANTDVVKSVTITLDKTGTWVTDNTQGLYVFWLLMCGTTYQTAPNVWTAGSNLFASPSQFNFMATAGNVFELFDVSLTEGTTALPFVVPDYAQELLACQRYYYKINGVALLGVGQAYTATSSGGTVIMLPCEMRALPQVTFSSAAHFQMTTPAGGATVASAMSISATSRLNAIQIGTSTFAATGGSAGQSTQHTLLSGGWLAVSARL